MAKEIRLSKRPGRVKGTQLIEKTGRGKALQDWARADLVARMRAKIQAKGHQPQ